MSVQINQSDTELLRTMSREHAHERVRLKALVLLLKVYNTAHSKIAEILGITANTVLTYLKEFAEYGISALTTLKFRKPESMLAAHEEKVREYLRVSSPANIKQACAEIKLLTGVELKDSQMRVYLRSLGAERRKVCGIPAKANVEKQKLFLDQELQPRLDEAQAGTRVVKFVDAAHFVLGGCLGFVWSLERIFVRTPSGRQRYNVLGAVDAVSKKMLTVSNTSYITSTQVCSLLDLIAEETTDLPITIVLDNAKYQHCQLVLDKAKKLGIELLFLPPYSPNLNLIERIWKFLRQGCLQSKYYATFQFFRQAIDAFLQDMFHKYDAELKSLLTLKFQLFKVEQWALAK